MSYFYSSTDGGRPQGGTEVAGVSLRVAWSQYVESFADWKVFATFTFENPDVSKDTATFCFRRWWQILNQDLFGHNYTRIVGHGYCAYALAFEKQARGTWHMHGLFSDRINFQLAHSIWKSMAGFLWLDGASEAHPTYLCKYITKGGEISLYKPSKLKQPAFIPDWYSGQSAGKAIKVAHASKKIPTPPPAREIQAEERQLSLPVPNLLNEM